MKKNYCLTEEKKLLLQIIFEKEEEKKLLLWQKWDQKIDIETDIDSEIYHLLPLLYFSLSSHKIKTEEKNRLKGIYRRSWYNNKLHYQNLHEILASFNEDNIFPIILGDLVMAIHYYQEIALRPIYKYELFVLPNQINLAVEKLEKLGWKSTFKLSKLKTNIYSRLVMTNARGNCLILYGQLWIEKLKIKNQDDIVSMCQTINIGDYQSYILNPIPQVLAICLENIFFKFNNLTRLIVDLNQVLIHHFLDIDLPLLTKKIKEYQFNYSYQIIVEELFKIKQDKLLIEIVHSFKNLKVTPLENQELNIIEKTDSLTIKDKIIRRYLLYFRTYGKSHFW